VLCCARGGARCGKPIHQEPPPHLFISGGAVLAYAKKKTQKHKNKKHQKQKNKKIYIYVSFQKQKTKKINTLLLCSPVFYLRYRPCHVHFLSQWDKALLYTG
jgi:hypothetical protein